MKSTGTWTVAALSALAITLSGCGEDAGPLPNSTAIVMSSFSGAVKVQGNFRIQQKGGNDGSSVMRYLDCYDDGASPTYKVITRPFQSNPSQWWYLESVGDLEDKTYTIQQVGANNGSPSGRFLDAFGDSSRDYNAVTRTDQHNPSQQWHFTIASGGTNTFTIQQVGSNDGSAWSGISRRYLDAYEGTGGPAHDWQVVTREWQGNPSQEWVITPLSVGEELLIANLAQPGRLWIMAPTFLCGVVLGSFMMAMVVGFTRRPNRALPDGIAPLLEHKAGTV